MANTNATLQFPWLILCWNLRNKLAVVRISQILQVMLSKVSPDHGRIYINTQVLETRAEAAVWLMNKRYISNLKPARSVLLI